MGVDIVSLRLQNQHLSSPDFRSPEDVVDYFGAMQAQDFNAAIWSIGLRMRRSTYDEIESSFNAGKILRTHVMRPTWHFVMPEDIRWMLTLTTPGVKKRLAPYDRRLDIDQPFLGKCHQLIRKSLEGGNYLTRGEIGTSLSNGGIEVRGQKLGHIMVHMELDGLVCSGPRRGKHMTYALLEEWVAPAKSVTRGQALVKLALKYFRSHGPAQTRDFEWWSGLSLKDASEAVEAIKESLNFVEREHGVYYFIPNNSVKTDPSRGNILMMSIFDEFSIAYKDRSDINIGRQRDIENMIGAGNALTAVILVNGKAAGSWKRSAKNGGIEVSVSPFRMFTAKEKETVVAEVSRYGRFLGIPSSLRWTQVHEIS